MQLRAKFAAVWQAGMRTFPRCAGPDCAATPWLWQLFRKQVGIQFRENQSPGKWYCSVACFEKAALRFFSRGAPAASAVPAQHRIPLGLLLISRGQLSERELQRGLQIQRDHGGGRLGFWLEKLGFTTEQQITAGLGLQWACPVFPPMTVHDEECARMVPLCWLEKFRMLPVHFSSASRMLHVAFSETVEYAALYAIECMLDCRTQACLISSRAMDQALVQLTHACRQSEMRFEGRRKACEMVRATGSFMLHLGAGRVRIVDCNHQIWVRLESGADATHLLFERPLIGEESGVSVGRVFGYKAVGL